MSCCPRPEKWKLRFVWREAEGSRAAERLLPEGSGLAPGDAGILAKGDEGDSRRAAASRGTGNALTNALRCFNVCGVVAILSCRATRQGDTTRPRLLLTALDY